MHLLLSVYMTFTACLYVDGGIKASWITGLNPFLSTTIPAGTVIQLAHDTERIQISDMDID
jgi:hypothetical protein